MVEDLIKLSCRFSSTCSKSKDDWPHRRYNTSICRKSKKHLQRRVVQFGEKNSRDSEHRVFGFQFVTCSRRY